MKSLSAHYCHTKVFRSQIASGTHFQLSRVNESNDFTNDFCCSTPYDLIFINQSAKFIE